MTGYAEVVGARARRMLTTSALLTCGVASAAAQQLELPPRPADAPGGAQLVVEIRDLDLEAREHRILYEIARGNVPGWLRELKPVELEGVVDRREYAVTLWAAADYLAVGSDADYLLIPLSPQTAQRIADLVGASLPTPIIVDAIWKAAEVRLGNDSIPPGPEMVTVPVFARHNGLVRARRDHSGAPLGALVAGHKKDVVLTPLLDALAGRVAIYGWHRPSGEPIQPLYAGHTDRHVDYSHGIRLIARTVLVQGVEHDLLEALRSPLLARLFSAEGVMNEPRYSFHTQRRE